jgi:hypothetical protein
MHKGREEREENNYFAKFYRKKNSTHFPSMAVCYATAVGSKKGKSTWGVEIPQYNPLPSDERA